MIDGEQHIQNSVFPFNWCRNTAEVTTGVPTTFRQRTSIIRYTNFTPRPYAAWISQGQLVTQTGNQASVFKML